MEREPIKNSVKVNEASWSRERKLGYFHKRRLAEFPKSTDFPGRLYMKKIFFLVVIGMVFGLAQMSYSAALVDVPSGHWAEDAVQKLVDSGMIKGYPDGTFKGDRNLSRYEYALVVERMMNLIDKTYCTKSECKDASGQTVSLAPEDLEEVKTIIKKLAAEFKDEIAALKVKIDENSTKIAALEEDVRANRFGNIQISGSVRQRLDIPNTDLSSTSFVNDYLNIFGSTATSGNLAAGYEMLPSITITGQAGMDVDFSIGFDKSIRTSPLGYDQTPGDDTGELVINHAYVDTDFSSMVRELDNLNLRTGYQAFAFGPYGMLVDNTGVTSIPAVMGVVSKDLVTITGIGGLARMDSLFTNGSQGLGSAGKDPYGAARVDIDLPWIDLGFNYLINGIEAEKGWGADIVAPLLTESPFLTEVRGEYMTVTDKIDGSSPTGTEDDYSFIIGLDVYKNSRAGLTLSYADLPAAVSLSSMDVNPFTEYDNTCPIGLDVKPTNCYSYESGRMLFPAGFEGLGVEASYIVLGDVELAAKGFIGNFAGGSSSTIANLDGEDYPGFGALSITKPINDNSSVRVEYAQQGKDPILLNRVRGELLINF